MIACLYRILLNHVLLSPWAYIGCVPESEHIPQCVANCRILATVIYEVIRAMPSSHLPPIASSASTSSRQPSSPGGRRRSTSSQAAHIITPSTAVSTINRSPIDDSKQDTITERLIYNFSCILGYSRADLARIEAERMKHKEIVKHLSAPREPFESLADVCYMLHPIESLPETYRAKIHEWVVYLSPLLNDWIEDLVTQVLTLRPCPGVTAPVTSIEQKAEERSLRRQTLCEDASASVKTRNKVLLQSLQVDKPVSHQAPPLIMSSRIMPVE